MPFLPPWDHQYGQGPDGFAACTPRCLGGSGTAGLHAPCDEGSLLAVHMHCVETCVVLAGLSPRDFNMLVVILCLQKQLSGQVLFPFLYGQGWSSVVSILPPVPCASFSFSAAGGYCFLPSWFSFWKGCALCQTCEMFWFGGDLFGFF